jgi:predicted enzyme related to lactoylglutathione lyase
MGDEQSAAHPRDEMAMFKFYPDLNLSGAIQRVPDPSGLMRAGRGGICMYWFVEDVAKTASLVEQAGGKVLGGVEKEGKTGVYQYFEDTEGNVGAAYQMVESNEGF